MTGPLAWPQRSGLGGRAGVTLASIASVLLTLSCLGPLFTAGGGWVLPAVVAVLVASAGGTLGRLLPLPALTGTVLVVAGGLVLVTAVSAPTTAWLGVVPTGSTFQQLHQLVSAGFSDIRSYSPPVHASPGLVLLTTIGVFAVAVAVDLLAVAAEHPVVAGLPLLALVAVPASFRAHGLGWVHLLLAMAGWLLLLTVDGRQRLSTWGRPLGQSAAGGGGGPRSPAALGRAAGGVAGRVAGLGVLAAFALPALVPALHGGVFHPHSLCCGGSATVVPPITTINSQLHQHTAKPLIRVTTNSPQYLRFAALDDFDGNQFSLARTEAAPGEVNGQLASATPGLGSDVPQVTVNATIAVLPALAERYLPLPYSPQNVVVSGHWQLSPSLRTIFSTTDTTAGLTIDDVSLVPEPTAAQLSARAAGYVPAAEKPATVAALKRDLALPAGLPAVVAADVKQVTRGQSTAYAKALALQKWFTTSSLGHFTYTLQPSPALPAGSAGIAAFLRYRQGFCEQFATVFTLMARQLGLPARVAVGFTPGVADPQLPSTYDIDSTDAHAWPEVWFTGVGWVRFEPTPRSDTAPFLPGYLASQAAAAPLPSASATTSAPATTSSPSASASSAPVDLKPNATAATPTGSSLPLGDLAFGAAAVLVVLLLASPGLARARLRRRRLAGQDGGRTRQEGTLAGEAYWRELIDTLADVGIARPASETPRATGRWLAGLLAPAGGTAASPGAAPPGSTAAGRSGPRVVEAGKVGPAGTAEPAGALAAIGRLVSAEEQARFGRPSTAVSRLAGAASGRAMDAAAGARTAGGPAADDVRLVRRALLASVPKGVRMRARLAPRSLLSRRR